MNECYCSSCGLPIPSGQGSSCSMCYGDISYGKDDYYRKWAEQQIQRAFDEQIDKENHTRLTEDF